MPRYFFNVYDDIIAPDHEGVELPSEAAARLQAIIGARDIMAEQVKHGYLERSHWIDVVGEEGEILFKLNFGEAVEIRE